jgi:hypothetical protein
MHQSVLARPKGNTVRGKKKAKGAIFGDVKEKSVFEIEQYN